MEFYCLVLRKKVMIPDKQVKVVTKNGRRYAKGVYKVGKNEYKVSRILGKK